jgi:hypothetical protein
MRKKHWGLGGKDQKNINSKRQCFRFLALPLTHNQQLRKWLVYCATVTRDECDCSWDSEENYKNINDNYAII